MPRVSIGLPVFNGERFIEQSIRSVLQQTFTDLELVVADNASTDRTVEIVEGFAAHDPRVTLLRSDQNRGAAWNYNRVFDHSTGELFRWHAHDDWFEPQLIERLVDALDAAPDAVLAHSWTRFVDDDGVTTRAFHDDLGASGDRPHDRLAATIRRLTFCNAVFGLVRRDVLAETARIAAFPGSDVPLIYELAVRGKFAVVPELLYVRRPGASIKANPSKKQVAEWFDPRGRGRRFPGALQARATFGAIWRSDDDLGERVATTLTFVRVWPPTYLRKRHRRSRRAVQV
jgi:glycosyltransferase involved in cell wall biosynthesis